MHAQWERFYKQLYIQALGNALASFRARAKSIHFYDVPVGYVKEELRFCWELEPFNTRDATSILSVFNTTDANSIWLKCSITSRGRFQLT